MTKNSQGVKAFGWLLKHINDLPENIKIWHNGYCGKCGRMLTVPDSIDSGFGPVCANSMNK